MTTLRLAVDIGGTFTDVVLERADRSRVTTKTLTTHEAPEKGVLSGVEEVLAAAGAEARDVSVVIHGTTLATNALIEKRGAKTALLTTEGHRDSLEMAYENRFEQYDINIDRPPPLVPRWLRLPVRERMNARGDVIVPLDESTVEAALPVLEEAQVESIAIGFLHAYANPSHEERAAEIISNAQPDISITLASETAPEIREYERQTTAVANAYVRPLMERYLHRLDGALKSRGLACPFLLMTSGGGLATLETAAKFPIRLVESGPAGGAVLAASIARSLSLPSLLSFDMGGTTAKICLIDDYEPATARSFEVDRSYRFKKGSGLPLRIPVLEMVEIGAGGGSIASVDALQRIQVGPESAGSDPGPVAYNKGGVRPTVTDADTALGRIDPARFAAGAIKLDVDKAGRTIKQTIADALDLTEETAAFGVCEIVDENMAAAARAHAVEQGRDIAARTMIAFGGAAPLHASRLAEKLGIRKLVIPQGAGVGSAIGFLLAPASYEIIRSRPVKLESFDAGAIEALFSEMRAEAERVVRSAVADEKLTETCAAYMRYAGQGHEIATPLVGDLEAALAPSSLKESFEKAYRAYYGRIIPGMPVEVMSWSLHLTGPSPAQHEAPSAAKATLETAAETRSVFDAVAGARIAYGVFDRTRLENGAGIRGPALVIEDQTTTVISSAFNAEIDGAGNLVLTREEAQ